jgi:hypothetical protein
MDAYLWVSVLCVDTRFVTDCSNVLENITISLVVIILKILDVTHILKKYNISATEFVSIFRLNGGKVCTQLRSLNDINRWPQLFTYNTRRWTKSRCSTIPSVTCYKQNPLELTLKGN